MAKESVLAPFHISWPPLNLPVAPFGSGSRITDRQPDIRRVHFHHHRQRHCARRWWLRDQSRSRLYKEGAHMASLFFTCPTTHQQAPTGIETDVQSLQAAWKATLKVKCPHCGEVHQISVRETYINGALQDASGRLRGAI